MGWLPVVVVSVVVKSVCAVARRTTKGTVTAVVITPAPAKKANKASKALVRVLHRRGFALVSSGRLNKRKIKSILTQITQLSYSTDLTSGTIPISI